MKIEAMKVGSRVEVAIQGSDEFVGDPTKRIGAYDDPHQAIIEARLFLREALAAAHHDGMLILGQGDLIEREHAAWLDVGLEFAAKGIDIDEGGWSQLVYAIRKWGEELHQLRLGDPLHDDTALREAREAYEGQYERGTYPEAIDRG